MSPTRWSWPSVLLPISTFDCPLVMTISRNFSFWWWFVIHSIVSLNTIWRPSQSPWIGQVWTIWSKLLKSHQLRWRIILSSACFPVAFRMLSVKSLARCPRNWIEWTAIISRRQSLVSHFNYFSLRKSRSFLVRFRRYSFSQYLRLAVGKWLPELQRESLRWIELACF